MKIIISLILTFAAVTSNLLHAGVISGAHTTTGGKSVNLSDLAWMSLDITADLRRTTVQNNLDNNLYGVGWRFATRSETELLLDSLWGSTTETWYWDNYDGASWFGDNFGWLSSYTDHRAHLISETHFFFGRIGECRVGVADSCIGSVRLDEFGTGPFSSQGFFMDGFGLSVGVDSLNEAYATSSTYHQFNYGSLLVNSVENINVPEPNNLILILAGGTVLYAFGLRPFSGEFSNLKRVTQGKYKS